ncbi:MAG TPA: T9SS type A sorting domain-containing protein [Bacteroidia bacterium]|nr:T9SS type A sorting domain-containing protein [Bacteroidia bacterium]
MRTLVFCLAILFLSIHTYAQTPGCEWVNYPTGSGSDNSYTYASAYDKYGNSFVIGVYGGVTGVLDIDPSANIFAVTGSGLFVAKYDPAGSVLWLAPIDIGLLGPQSGIALPSIACDSVGDVYITGGANSVTLDFDHVSTSNSPLVTAGGADMFLAKYNGSGVPQWSFLVGAGGNEEGQTIVCEGSKVYVGGFYGSNTDFDPSSGTYTPVVPISCTAGFIAMYTSAGQFIWQNSLQGVNSAAFGNCTVMSLAIDKNLQILATGIFWGTVDFSPVANFDTLAVYQAGISSPYLAKYDSTGAFIFAKLLANHTGTGFGYVAVDNASNIILGGYFDGVMDFDLGAGVVMDTVNNSGHLDCFIAKYDNAGNYLWHGQFGSTDIDYIRDISIDGNNNILVGGGTRGILDVDMGPAVFNTGVNGNCSGCDDGFVSKYTSSGQLLLGFSVSAFANDGVWAVECFGDKFSATGLYSGTIDFDPSADTLIVAPLVTNGMNYFHAQYFDSTFISGIEPAGVLAPAIRIYPNPCGDYFQVDNFAEYARYEIINNAGQVVRFAKSTQRIDVRELAAGAYVVVFTTADGVMSRAPFVKD